jgi:hypothetical protein
MLIEKITNFHIVFIAGSRNGTPMASDRDEPEFFRLLRRPIESPSVLGRDRVVALTCFDKNESRRDSSND